MSEQWKGKWRMSHSTITSVIAAQIMMIVTWKREQLLPQEFQAWCQGYFYQLTDLQLVTEKIH